MLRALTQSVQLAQHRRSAEAHGTAADEAELTDFRTPVASRGNINGSAAELDGVEMEKQQRALQSALEEEEREADMIRSTSQTTLAHFRSRQNLDDLASADSEWSTMDGDHLGVSGLYFPIFESSKEVGNGNGRELTSQQHS